MKFLEAVDLAIEPFDFNARLLEGALRLVRGDYELAIQSFRFAAEERPNSSTLHTNFAIAYIFLKRNEKALASARNRVRGSTYSGGHRGAARGSTLRSRGLPDLIESGNPLIPLSGRIF